MQTLAQETMVVQLLKPTDQSGSSISKSNATYVSMKNYRRAHFILTAGSMTEATTSVQIYQAKSVSGSSISATALALGTYWTNKASVSTGVFVRTAASSSKIVVDATSLATYVWDVSAAELDTDSGYDCLAVGVAGVGGAANFALIAILSNPRYEKDAMPTALAD